MLRVVCNLFKVQQRLKSCLKTRVSELPFYHFGFLNLIVPALVTRFDRDPETNEMLWFSGAPIDVAKTPLPKYSLDYLYFLALKKKKAAAREGAANGVVANGEPNDGFPNKRRRTEVPVPRLTGEALLAALLST